MFNLLFLPTYTPSDKILLCLWNKNILTEIYRNIQTFAFKVLQDYSSWASRNGAVQMFFWHQTETCLLENFKAESCVGCFTGTYYFQCQES